jgi:hypothetical protein
MNHTFTQDELSAKIHTAAAVVKATGILPTDLQQLCNRKVINFAVVKFGGRTFRRFSLLEILTVKAMEVIRRFNLEYSKADRMISGVRQTVGQYCLREEYTSARRYVMIFDHETFAGAQLFFPGESPVGNMSNYRAKAAIVLDLEAIIEDAMSDLMDEEGPGEADGSEGPE